MSKSSRASDPYTFHAVRARIRGLTKEQQKAVVCALVGHSRIVDFCMWQYSCSRCGDVVGDSLTGTVGDRAKGWVIVGHGCDACIENYERMGWRDKFLAHSNPVEENVNYPDPL